MGGKADSTQHAEFIFLEAFLGDANGADEAVFKIFLAGDEVVESVGERVEEEAVDGEVAPFGIFSRRAEGDVVGVAAIVEAFVVAEGGDFKGVALEEDKDDAKLSTYRDSFGEE